MVMSENTLSGGASGKDWGSVVDPDLPPMGVAHEIAHDAGYGLGKFENPNPFTKANHPNLTAPQTDQDHHSDFTTNIMFPIAGGTGIDKCWCQAVTSKAK